MEVKLTCRLGVASQTISYTSCIFWREITFGWKGMWRKSLVSVDDWDGEVFIESLMKGFSSSTSILVIADWNRGDDVFMEMPPVK